VPVGDGATPGKRWRKFGERLLVPLLAVFFFSCFRAIPFFAVCVFLSSHFWAPVFISFFPSLPVASFPDRFFLRDNGDARLSSPTFCGPAQNAHRADKKGTQEQYPSEAVSGSGQLQPPEHSGPPMHQYQPPPRPSGGSSGGGGWFSPSTPSARSARSREGCLTCKQVVPLHQPRSQSSVPES
jgi:hypothetical protein